MNDQQTVTLGEYFQGTTTDWVDPVTGAPVKVETKQHVYLANSSGTPVLTLLNADFTTTPATVAAAVKTAKSDDTKVSLIILILPVVIGLAGLIFLVIGIVLLRSRNEYEEYDESSAEDYEGGEVPA